MKHRKNFVGKCVYCGVEASLEKEDVIPKCLFPKPRPNDLVKVPACRPCNLAKSKDDDYLRDLLASDISTDSHPIARSFLRTKMLSSVQQNSSSFARTAIARGRTGPYHTREGIYLGRAVAIPVDGDRISRIFATIVRGLYFKANGSRIPDSYTFDVRRIDMLAFNRYWPELKKIGFNGPHTIGTDVFTCIWVKADVDPFLTVWWLFFYDTIGIVVATEDSTDSASGSEAQPN